MEKSFYIISFFLILAAIAVSVSISATQIGLGVLIVALIYYLYKNSIDITSDCPYFFPFFFYWLSTLLPFFFGSNYAEASGNVFKLWTFLYLFITFYLITEKNVDIFLFFLIIGSVALGITIIYTAEVMGVPRGKGFLTYMTGGNILALSATLCFGLLVSGYVCNIFLKVFYGVSCILIITSIFYTETRGALLSFLVAACLMLLLKYRIKGVLASILLLTTIGAVAYFTPIGVRFFEIFKTWDINTSHGWRLELWRQTWVLIKEYPFFGIGSGAFFHLIKPLMPSYINLPLTHPHNGFITQLVLYGFVGFGAFCLFYGKMAVTFLRNIKINEFAFIGFFFLLAYMAEGLTENNFQDSELAMYSCMVLGLCLGMIKKRRTENIR